ncbi:MAG: peptide chain release factor N(5)-glutamine methyltransferase [Candidatus Tectomicrobia bacterium]|uniref:Release factor glutamine methyltransferase n=1 Tax=Tectimicrobiota bacterium TaxID=2528274 RepID=A0A932MND4_UNCTE|nr:peptide chain release factor N(5)-glutamine methyltransferase [Candidatus Tectomicrobia bacterium]
MSGGLAVPALPRTAGAAAAELRRRFAAAGVENPAGDAEVLLAWLLGCDRARLHAHPETGLSLSLVERLDAAAARRERREPLAYITGEKEFWSLPFRVGPGVLVPRPETELLVERGIALLREREAPLILDLGTGSGAVAVALAHELPRARVIATDVSETALRCARENARRNGVESRVELLRADLSGGLPEGAFDLVVSNPPYVPSGEIAGLMPEVSRHEPVEALDGGPDGMRFLRAIIRGAPARLRPGGALLLETAPGQIPLCLAEARAAGAFAEPRAWRDLAGRERVLEAVRA